MTDEWRQGTTRPTVAPPFRPTVDRVARATPRRAWKAVTTGPKDQFAKSAVIFASMATLRSTAWSMALR